jgi:hypothetical protein
MRRRSSMSLKGALPVAFAALALSAGIAACGDDNKGNAATPTPTANTTGSAPFRDMLLLLLIDY